MQDNKETTEQVTEVTPTVTVTSSGVVKEGSRAISGYYLALLGDE